MIVADTDVLIDFFNGREPSRSRIRREMQRGRLCTTVINRFELLSGARNQHEEDVLLLFLEWMPSLPLGSEAAGQAARVRNVLERQGRGMGRNDSLIAGIVLHDSGTLLTRNLRHFERVSGLRLEAP